VLGTVIMDRLVDIRLVVIVEWITVVVVVEIELRE
jgi:hypothetical protein